MPCTSWMPVLVVMFEHCGSGGGGGGGLPVSGGSSPPPPPQLTAAPAHRASAAARQVGTTRRITLLVAVTEPEAVLLGIAPLVRSDRLAVERLGLDRFVRRVGHEELRIPLVVRRMVAKAQVDHRIGRLHAEIALARVRRAQRAGRAIRAVFPAQELVVEIADPDARHDPGAVAELEGVRIDQRRLVFRGIRQVVAGEVEHVAGAGAARLDAEATGIPDAPARVAEVALVAQELVIGCVEPGEREVELAGAVEQRNRALELETLDRRAAGIR